jgi:hypothetical protein
MPDGAKVGARAVPGQRQALELTGVLREQLRVLRSQSGSLSCRAGCVLRSHAGDFLLGMPEGSIAMEIRPGHGKVVVVRRQPVSNATPRWLWVVTGGARDVMDRPLSGGQTK